jgi:hypothetical protein
LRAVVKMNNPFADIVKSSNKLLERSNRLSACEAEIAEGLAAFYKVGKALIEIRDGQLYKDHYPNFDAYCKDRWDIRPRYAQLVMRSTKVVAQLEANNCSCLPINEAQARPLTQLKTAEKQQEAWKRALELAKANGGKVTAKLVQSAVDEITAPTPEEVAEMKARSDELCRSAGIPTDEEYEASKPKEKERTASQLLDDIKNEFDEIRKLFDEIMEDDAKIFEGLGGCLNNAKVFGGLDQAMVARFIKVAYREMSKECHPDAGGSAEDMIKLNLIKDAFRGLMGLK